MKDFVIHWLRKDGTEYATTVVTKRHHPAAIRYAANALTKTMAMPGDPSQMSPLAAYGFYVTEAPA